MFIRFCYSPLVLVSLIWVNIMPNHAQAATLEIKSILSNIEVYAEKMVGTALQHDAQGLRNINTHIQQNISALHDQLNTQDFNEKRSRELLMAYSWTRIISIDIKQHAWVGVAIAANQLSASMIRVTNYTSLQKRNVEWMDYLAREVLLLNMEDPKENNELLRVRYTDLQNTWQHISKELINNFRNKPLVLEGDGLMLQLKEAGNVENIMHIAEKILTFIHKIENIQ